MADTSTLANAPAQLIFSRAMRERSSIAPGALPPLNALRAFESVVRTGAVGAAAAELCVTPSAISHQLRTLEHYLDVKLLAHRGRKLELTDAGRAYFGAISPALTEIVRGTAAVFGRDEQRRISVAAMPVFAVRWLIPRLGAFRRRHPEVEVRVSTSYRYVDLHESDIDLALRFGEGAWENVHAELLLQESVQPVCSAAFLEGRAPVATAADLLQLPLVHMVLGRNQWDLWARAQGLAHAPTGSALHFDEPLGALQAAVDGLGVALGPKACVMDDLRAGRLMIPYDAELPAGGGHYLVHTKRAGARPAVRAFCAWLRDEARDLRTPWGSIRPPQGRMRLPAGGQRMRARPRRSDAPGRRVAPSKRQPPH
jgi:LysR family transcriptional regulator, glycine cleavage system transcriptional activator